ncbi:hypothetical protein CYMTET_18811 [Cymbomonas tetramitiformis]|uniref:RNA helicase n=1 Tax=Cymbomonas tetramitiformis TaxID=36881 RepID=A0AAE0G7V9_9CHLO|nr:hypothetical protein CYMTET_18811 [Cymbomonas tetramitiformis]
MGARFIGTSERFVSAARLTTASTDAAARRARELAATAVGHGEKRAVKVQNRPLSGSEDLRGLAQGYVWKCLQTDVLVHFCQDFVATDRTFHVRFSFNRMQMRQFHRGVDRVDLDVIWPEECPEVANEMGGIGEEAELAVTVLDEMQSAAVANILRRRVLLKQRRVTPAPLLLRGSFGCGKTRTLLEAVRQAAQEGVPVLVCAESNAAGDLLCEKLAPHFTPHELFRLNAFRRAMPGAVVKRHSLYDQAAEVFNIPPREVLQRYKVVVCTADTAGHIIGVGVPPGHFGYVFVDECAQMMEPKAMVPVALAAGASASCCTVVVLAGDDKQIGPRVQSESARHHGLQLSIMERLAALPSYRCSPDGLKEEASEGGAARAALGSSRPDLVFELSNNYRSHPALLELPSRLFYDGRLVSRAPSQKVSSLCQWRKLPNPHFPLLFVGVEGEDAQEGDSPSFFNIFEAIQIKDLVSDLLRTQRMDPQDVTVISPYRKQQQKIRLLLREASHGRVQVRALTASMPCPCINAPGRRPSRFNAQHAGRAPITGNTRVGGPEVLQGRETRAVFISTVRARKQWVQVMPATILAPICVAPRGRSEPNPRDRSEGVALDDLQVDPQVKMVAIGNELEGLPEPGVGVGMEGAVS